MQLVEILDNIGNSGAFLRGRSVTLINYREAVLARLGQLDASQIHRYETEALVDTGAIQSVIPPAVAERLGLLRLRRTEARYVNDQVEEVDVSEVFTIELMGRQAHEDAMIVGTHVLLGVTALEKMDLMVDTARQRLVPNEGTWDQPVFRV
jgi:clan AA aspartic protease